VAETVKREAACPESTRPGRFGAANERAGITFTARTNLTLIDLRGDPQDPQFRASAQSALGTALPLEPNTAGRSTHCAILWLGPDEWLLTARHSGFVNERLAISGGFLTDVSSGKAAWQITGPRSTDLLAKGCSLDLHTRAFPDGNCAQTALAHVAVLLHRRDNETFDLYCARSYSQHVWHWMCESALEFGYAVAAPVDL